MKLRALPPSNAVRGRPKLASAALIACALLPAASLVATRLRPAGAPPALGAGGISGAPVADGTE